MGTTITNLKITSTGGGENSLVWAGASTSENSPTTDVTLQFNNDGTISGPFGAPTKWLTTTPDTTTAALYEIRFTGFTGTLTNSTALTLNTWYALSLDRSFRITGTQGAASRFGNLSIEIRKIAVGGTGTTATWTHELVGSV